MSNYKPAAATTDRHCRGLIRPDFADSRLWVIAGLGDDTYLNAQERAEYQGCAAHNRSVLTHDAVALLRETLSLCATAEQRPEDEVAVGRWAPDRQRQHVADVAQVRSEAARYVAEIETGRQVGAFPYAERERASYGASFSLADVRRLHARAQALGLFADIIIRARACGDEPLAGGFPPAPAKPKWSGGADW